MKSNTEPSRREIIRLGGYGLGALAVSSLCNSRFVEGAPLAPQIRTRAKSVIWLVMNGGQSHVDTWDYKPQLAKSNGKKLEGFDNEIGFFPEKLLKQKYHPVKPKPKMATIVKRATAPQMRRVEVMES